MTEGQRTARFLHTPWRHAWLLATLPRRRWGGRERERTEEAEMVRWAVAALVIASLFVMVGGLHARAQEGTPAPEQTGLPVTPDPSECTVQPLTIDEIIAIVGSPVPGGADTETDEGDDAEA